jgi:ferric-dicitrate binding protein FerR (iron transport regulator)
VEKQVLFELLIKYSKGDATPEEIRKIENWRKKNPENESAALDFLMIHQSFNNEGLATNEETENALFKMNSKLNRNTQSDSKRRIPLPNLLLRIAAALIIVAGGLYTISKIGTPREQVFLVKETTSNSRKFVNLSDGSRVWLSQNTILKHPEAFPEKQRRVSLNGEAYFDIAEEPKRPFIIDVKKTKVQVLGTAFNIKTDTLSNQIIVSVTDGRVLFSANENNIHLIAGEQGVFHSINGEFTRKKNFNPNILSWKTNILIFKNASLSKVAEDLSRHYNRKIKLKEIPDSIRFNGRFEDASLNEVLELLEFTLEIDAFHKDGTIILKHKSS